MDLIITDSAVRRLLQLVPYGSALRIRVIGGGCSGLEYKLSTEETKADLNSEDGRITISGILILVDKKSAIFLKSLTLDYSDGLNGTGFEFINPNAKRVCGCGSSFSF